MVENQRSVLIAVKDKFFGSKIVFFLIQYSISSLISVNNYYLAK